MPNSRIWDRRLQRSQLDGIQRKLEGVLEETTLEEKWRQEQETVAGARRSCLPDQNPHQAAAACSTPKPTRETDQQQIEIMQHSNNLIKKCLQILDKELRKIPRELKEKSTDPVPQTATMQLSGTMTEVCRCLVSSTRLNWRHPSSSNKITEEGRRETSEKN